MKYLSSIASVLTLFLLMTSGCAVREHNRVVAPLHVESYDTNYSGPKVLNHCRRIQ